MRISLLSWFFFNLYIATFFIIAVVSVSGQCQSDQREFLLGFKNSLNSSLSVKLVTWNESTDCCSWDGITCDASGRVTELDLSNQFISGPFPKLLAEFQNLTSLDLALNNLSGSVPGEILQAPKLQTLDLSSNIFLQGSFKKFRQNASLQSLIVSGTNFGGQLPKSIGNLGELRRIELAGCTFNGPIPKTLEKLARLTYLDFHNNSFSGPVPSFTSLRNLTVLDLRFNLLNGSILSTNWSSLLNLVFLGLGYNIFSGNVPHTLFRSQSLKEIDLSHNHFNGSIPKTLEKLTQLTYMDFSNNNFSGSILSTNWSSLLNLVILRLGQNSFSGNVPPTLFRSQSLKEIDLHLNQFTGGFSEVKGEYSSLLESIDLSGNRLQGPFPMFVSEIQSLEILSLSWNNFSGLILLSAFQKLQNLQTLDLSYNNLSIDSSSTNPLLPPLLPNISRLSLASCNLTKFPDFLKNLPSLHNLYFRPRTSFDHLDLSNNRIHGEIPSWVWKIKYISHLNLSLNFLVEFETSLNIFPSHVLHTVDLHGNQLQGQIPPEIGDFLQYTRFFSLSGNRISGSIPESICNSSSIELLDLSNNSLSGPIPQCLIQMTASIGVLNLKRNNLSGEIPDAFPVKCALQTLNLNRNRLGGKIPKSLANCTMLEVLDLGRNRIDDTFPCHLKSSSRLRVLVLRSNKFKGDVNCRGSNVTWPMLQIIDLASNSFSGKLPQGLLMTWNAMKAEKHEPYPEQLRFIVPGGNYFQDSVTVIMKGQELELVKILTIFTSIDLSSNKFQGHIPEAIGDFRALYLLNLSNNALAGTVPSFLGNMSNLESLDLSRNHLTGQIPLQLASLNFLSFLNLSNNKLMGKIPSGTQLQSFSEASYENNAGLCGLPLKVQCEPPPATKDRPSNSGTGNHTDWNLISVEIGFVFGFGVVIVPLMFWKRWRVWYYKRIDRVLYKFFPKLDRKNRYRGTIARWPQRRRQ